MGVGCRVITPRPLYPRERTHPATCAPQRRSALFGGEDKSVATAGIESRIVCVRKRITVNRKSGYSKDFFIHCHHYDFSCTVIITTCSYTVIITTFHALSSLRLFVHCHHYDLFIHCHHYDYSCTVIITTCSYIVIITTCSYTVIITTCSYTVIITTFHALSSLRLVHTLL